MSRPAVVNMLIRIEVEFSVGDQSVREKLRMLEHCVKEGLYGRCVEYSVDTEMRRPKVLLK